jgi:hypothetical protein
MHSVVDNNDLFEVFSKKLFLKNQIIFTPILSWSTDRIFFYTLAVYTAKKSCFLINPNA